MATTKRLVSLKLLSLLTFVLFFSASSTTQAVGTPSTTLKVVPGVALMAAGGIGTWYCYKQLKQFNKDLEALEAKGTHTKEELEMIKRGQWCAKILMGISCGALATGAGLTLWGGLECLWQNDEDFPVNEEIQIVPGLQRFIQFNDDGSYEYYDKNDDGTIDENSRDGRAADWPDRALITLNANFEEHEETLNHHDAIAKAGPELIRQSRTAMAKLRNGQPLTRKEKFLITDFTRIFLG